MTLDEFRKARAQEKRIVILSAGETCFLRSGYARTTMESIAQEAGVSTATIYRHFEGKAEIFRAITLGLVDGLDLTRIPTDRTQNPEIALSALAKEYAVLLSSARIRAFMRMVISEIGESESLATEFFDTVKRQISDAFADLIEAGIANRSLRTEVDAALMAGQLQGMIEHGTLMRGLLLGDDASPLFHSEQIALEAMKTWLTRWAASSDTTNLQQS